jgi:hypothetical protein
LISSIVGTTFPDFPVYTQEGDTTGIFQFIEGAKCLILFLGPGCAPCDDRTIEIIAEYERTRARKLGLDIIALVFQYENEFIHLRKLTTNYFQGRTAKFSTTEGYDILAFPALYLLDKQRREVLNAHIPKGDSEDRLLEFLDRLMDKQFSISKTIPSSLRKAIVPVSQSLFSSKVFTSASNNSEQKVGEQGSNKGALILEKSIKLESDSKEKLLSQIAFWGVGKGGEFIFSHDLGRKITIWAATGEILTTLTDEDIFGPGARYSRRCTRIVAIDSTKLCLLFGGVVNDLVLYDWKKKRTELIPLKDKDEKRVHTAVNVAIHNDRIYLLSHPLRMMGYFSQIPEILEIDNEGIKRNQFPSFPDLKYPILTELLASDRDHLVISDGSMIYTASPLADRIYRFDLNGKRHSDFVYPKNSIVQPESDAPENPRVWHEYTAQFGKFDIINYLFCLRKANMDKIIVVRHRGKTLYFDLFDEAGKFTELGEFSNHFDEFRVAHSGNLFYGYKWPEVKDDQFVAYGNPEVFVYRLEF